MIARIVIGMIAFAGLILAACCASGRADDAIDGEADRRRLRGGAGLVVSFALAWLAGCAAPDGMWPFREMRCPVTEEVPHVRER